MTTCSYCCLTTFRPHVTTADCVEAINAEMRTMARRIDLLDKVRLRMVKMQLVRLVPKPDRRQKPRAS